MNRFITHYILPLLLTLPLLCLSPAYQYAQSVPEKTSSNTKSKPAKNKKQNKKSSKKNSKSKVVHLKIDSKKPKKSKNSKKKNKLEHEDNFDQNDPEISESLIDDQLPIESPRSSPLPIPDGFAQPYAYDNLMRQYNGNRCRHRGIDIGAVGTVHGGLGTPVRAITKSKVTFIGSSALEPGNFGKLDKRPGFTKRSGKVYPRKITIPGYGDVYPFTRNYGRWRSGTVIVTTVEGGIINGYTIRYMHLASIRPDVKIGTILEAGEELGIMGSTAIQDSLPHVHIDMENTYNKRVDPGPFIGLPETARGCRSYVPTPLSDPKAYEKYKHRLDKQEQKLEIKQHKKKSRTKSRPYKNNIKPEKTKRKQKTKPSTRTLERN